MYSIISTLTSVLRAHCLWCYQYTVFYVISYNVSSIFITPTRSNSIRADCLQGYSARCLQCYSVHCLRYYQYSASSVNILCFQYYQYTTSSIVITLPQVSLILCFQYFKYIALSIIFKIIYSVTHYVPSSLHLYWWQAGWRLDNNIRVE
jgi:hypothetical protein